VSSVLQNLLAFLKFVMRSMMQNAVFLMRWVSFKDGIKH